MHGGRPRTPCGPSLVHRAARMQDHVAQGQRAARAPGEMMEHQRPVGEPGPRAERPARQPRQQPCQRDGAGPDHAQREADGRHRPHPLFAAPGVPADQGRQHQQEKDRATCLHLACGPGSCRPAMLPPGACRRPGRSETPEAAARDTASITKSPAARFWPTAGMGCRCWPSRRRRRCGLSLAGLAPVSRSRQVSPAARRRRTVPARACGVRSRHGPGRRRSCCR